MPMRRKSTTTADNTVSTECHTPSLNLPRGTQGRVASPRWACYAAGAVHMCPGRRQVCGLAGDTAPSNTQRGATLALPALLG